MPERVAAGSPITSDRMRYLALATDYDGTIATAGRVPPSTRAALERWRQTGRALVLVTGRELDDVRRACQGLELFDRVVAENGAVLHRPAGGEVRLLSEPVPDALLVALRRRWMSYGVGRAVIGAWRGHADTVLEEARALGIDVQLSFNKSSVLVLPAGVDKASGVRAALAELGIPPLAAVGVGDAENDLPLLEACGLGVAVANAIPNLTACASRVTRGAEGAGVEELVADLLARDP
jgi:hydroxymethylpyrimidine pyrophosphatase-like HAD family hydrolase